MGRNKFKITVLAAAVAISLGGCATYDRYIAENNSWVSCVAGGVVGAAAGGLIAAANSKSIADGAVIGGMAGCGAGLLYKQRVDRLQAIAAEENLKMTVRELQATAASATSGGAPTLTSVGVEAQIELEEMFPVGSAQLTPEGARKLSRVAAEFVERQSGTPGQADSPTARKKVLVVGHTDATGSAEFNQKLSEQRARAVGQILSAAGISPADIYYQGAGASRPVASNTTAEGRAQNRRVEFVEVDNEALLVERVRVERSNSKYLAHGTAPVSVTKATVGKSPTPAAPSTPSTPASKPVVQQPVAKEPKPTGMSLEGRGGIDFAGQRVTDTRSQLAANIQPKTSTFAFISKAHADAPVNSCVADMPRVSGQVKNLASGNPLAENSTVDFLPGFNGKPWAAQVNGHIVALGPVYILREDAKVPQNPAMQFVTNAGTAQKKETPKYHAMANTYEGDTQVLYRVFAVDQKQSPVTCIDIVFDKRAGQAVDGEIYYPKQGDAYVAQFKPLRR